MSIDDTVRIYLKSFRLVCGGGVRAGGSGARAGVGSNRACGIARVVWGAACHASGRWDTARSRAAARPRGKQFSRGKMTARCLKSSSTRPRLYADCHSSVLQPFATCHLPLTTRHSYPFVSLVHQTTTLRTFINVPITYITHTTL